MGTRRVREPKHATRRVTALLAGALAVAAATAGPAAADFPYPGAGHNPSDPTTWHLAAGEVPSNFSDGDWKLTATPEQPSSSDPTAATATTANNAKQSELCGIRGGSVVDAHTVIPVGWGSCREGELVHTAFMTTTGRPDVTIAVLDSGIKWNDAGAMIALRKKVHLNAGELPAPRVDGPALDGSVSCAALTPPPAGTTDFDKTAKGYDVNGDGVFNVLDYACDPRVHLDDRRRNGPAGVLTPEDLIIAFSSTPADHDGNGFKNDIAGWDFVDNDNDPFDDVQYGHGTGEAEDSNGEANTKSDLGTCPNCTVLPLRVGESFVADVNRFAQATLYATDLGALVVQEALGTLNSSNLARDAIDYAYAHGVAIIASAADEAAEHHNQPGALPHAIVVNSVNKYNEPTASRSYLQFNGCTNFSTKVVVAVASVSCSSAATGAGAGVAGLIYSAALNAHHAGGLAASSDCTRVDGAPCVITPNEVRQLMGSGHIGSTAPADEGAGQADDVNFMAQPERSCATAPEPTCTDPNQNSMPFSPEQNDGVVAGPIPSSTRYPARKGFDEFYGYGRLNADRAVAAAAAAQIPPEAEITSPQWFDRIDPEQATMAIEGHVAARSAYTCEVLVAPGGQPNNAEDFHRVDSAFCAAGTHSAAHDGLLADVSLTALKGYFPPANPMGFDGPEFGAEPAAQFATNGRPNTMPYAFTVKVVVRTAGAGAEPPMSGEDRRQMFLHRDQDMRAGFPRELGTDGASTPLLVDVDGDNRNELVLATSDGVVHALRPDGSEAPGWPVHTDPLPLHLGEPAFAATGGVSSARYGAVLGSLAAGDLFHDGRLEIVADDMEGKVYAWDGAGHRVFAQEANLAYSGRPLTPFADVRHGERDRTDHAFYASPVLADLGGEGKELDIVAAGTDRHLYAWHPDGTPVAGFPVLVVDPDKVASVDRTTDHVTFDAAKAGDAAGQGKLVDTPAIARLHPGDARPTIVLGSNEEYLQNSGDEGAMNAGSLSAASLGALGATGILKFGNSRLYAIKADGTTSGDAFVAGWPKKIGLIDVGLLPDVGEGISGAPVIGSVTCANAGSGDATGPKIGVIPDAGPGYLFNPDGSSCYGTTAGNDNTLNTDASGGQGDDKPVVPALGHPAFATLAGKTAFVAPATGIRRALDVVVNEYQGGQDYLAAWNPETGEFLPNFPARVNDLQFLTGPSVGQILATPGEAIVGGSASLDLQAYNAAGALASPAWPKLTGDWTVANPTLGSFGTLDTDPAAHKDVVSITRLGSLAVYDTPAAACSPSSWPRFHHDDANSGDFSRDARAPGTPYDVTLTGRTLTFRAPGDDGLCGTATRYEVAESADPITPQGFASAAQVAGGPAPAAAGTQQEITLPADPQRHVAIRAVDDQGNIGNLAEVTTPAVDGGGGDGGSQGGGNNGGGNQGGNSGGGSTQAGGGTQGAGGDANSVRCAGAHSPRSRLARSGVRLARHGLRLRGTSRLTVTTCSRRVARVEVAVARIHGKRCRFLRANRRFGPVVSCRRPRYLRARGTARWTLTVRARLPRGVYKLYVHATSDAGVRERGFRHHNFLNARLR